MAGSIARKRVSNAKREICQKFCVCGSLLVVLAAWHPKEGLIHQTFPEGPHRPVAYMGWPDATQCRNNKGHLSTPEAPLTAKGVSNDFRSIRAGGVPRLLCDRKACQTMAFPLEHVVTLAAHLL